MRRLYISLKFVAIMLFTLLYGCAKEVEQQQPQEELHEVVFHAGWAPETKTVLQEDGSVWWSPGDEISLFVGDNTTNYKLTSTCDVASAATDFVGKVCSGDTYYALYPYSESNQAMGNKTFKIDIPSTQIATKGSYDKNAFISIATSTNDQLNFKNICGGVKFSVAKEGVRRVEFSVNDPEASNYEDIIAGTYLISLDEDGTPTSDRVGGSIILNVYPPDNGTFETGENYYAVMPVVNISSGITVKYYTDNSVAKWRYNIPFEIHRSKFKTLINKDSELIYNKIYDTMAPVVIPDEIDRRSLTGIEFHVNSDKVTTHPIREGLLYYEIEGTVLHLYTSAEVFDVGQGAWGLFSKCSSLTSLDLSNVRTTDCTNFGKMFHGCSRLANIKLNSFDTSSARTMEQMFSCCYSLSSLDLSNFDTSNVTNMSGMFSGCTSLTKLNIESFQTQEVQNMGSMFAACSGLASIDLSRFATSKVTDMSSLFSGCTNLRFLDISSFNTSNVADMNLMFSNCAALKALDVSGFNTSNVENMGNMFYGTRFDSLDLSNFNTSKVKNMNFMFGWCNALKNLNISSFTSDALEDASLMFCSCKNLHTLDLGSFDLSNATCTDVLAGVMSCSKVGAIRCLPATESKLKSVIDESINGRIHWMNLSEEISSFIYPKNPELYYSSDFSKHETVKQIQKSTIGKGIDIVIMGDAYSDRLINDGTYDKDMQLTADAIFSKEPFTSFKDYFNVYVVYLVSENEVVGESTALGAILSESGMLDGYISSACYAYHRILATNDPDLTKSEAIVVVNSDRLCGYTNMILGPSTSSNDDDPNLHKCDYGYGTANVVLGRGRGVDDSSYSIVASHEIGHSFAKLADEYWNDMDKLADGDLGLPYFQSKYGVFKNVDITSDPSKILWSKFLSDERYVNNVGIYEGGYLYGKGVWRPSENSIMRVGTEYNAPSRAAIYNRIHKLAFGDSWQFDYETFVQQDLKNIQSKTKSSPQSVPYPARVNERKPFFKKEKIRDDEGREMIRMIMN